MPSRKRSLEFSLSPSQGQTRPCPPPSTALAGNVASFNFSGAVNKQERRTVGYRSDIFEIATVQEEPATWLKKVDEGFGGFLKHCAMCRLKFAKDEDTYMYGFLGAYCSQRCRQRMIIFDGLNKLFPCMASVNKTETPACTENHVQEPSPCNLDDESDHSSDSSYC